MELQKNKSAYVPKPPVEKNCKHCGAEFETKCAQQEYCLECNTPQKRESQERDYTPTPPVMADVGIEMKWYGFAFNE